MARKVKGRAGSSPTDEREAREAREADLLARIADGERQAPLMELYDRYVTPVYRLGMRALGDQGRAEELVQQTFVRVWRSAGRYDRRESSVQGFVLLLARRAAIDLQRRAAARPKPAGGTEAVEAVEAVPDPEAEAELDKAVTGLEVREALETLSPVHRQVLELAYTGDLSQSQIADRLSVPLGTVKSRAHHALHALRAEFIRRGLHD